MRTLCYGLDDRGFEFRQGLNTRGFFFGGKAAGV
jgi:hypothetical protein